MRCSQNPGLNPGFSSSLCYAREVLPVIRTKTPESRLFYGADELHRPSRLNGYVRLNTAVGSWSALCAPLRSAFSLEKNGLPLGTVVADAGYYDSKFHAAVEDLGATPLTNYQAKNPGKTEGFGKESFRYDYERDVYICPNQAVLRPNHRTAEKTMYRSSKKVCDACPFRASCLGKRSRQRTIGRTQDEPARERNIARCHTDEGRAMLKKRKTVVEPPFAHMKRFGGLRLVNCRGTNRTQAKVTVTTIAWNLLKLARRVAQDATGGLKRLFPSRFCALGTDGRRGQSRILQGVLKTQM